MKNCKDCLLQKEENQFHKGKAYKNGLMSRCKECHRKRMKQWEIDNPEKVKKYWNNSNYKRCRKICPNCNNPYVRWGQEIGCSIACRLILNIEKNETDCWEWQKSFGTDGYGQVTYRKNHKSVHRLSYETFVGPIAQGKFVCHTCDNRKCLNPGHLWLGTCKENIQDMIIKGRAAFQKI